MAEAFLNGYAGDRYEVHSSGLKPQPINPLTIRVMQEKGYDLSGSRSKGIEQYLGKVLFQYLITVCADADRDCPQTWPGVSRRLYWPFEDPAAFEGPEEEKLAKFREVRDQIEQKVREWLESQDTTSFV